MTTPEQKSDKRISYQPTPGLSYDPSEARYWDPAALGAALGAWRSRRAPSRAQAPVHASYRLQ